MQALHSFHTFGIPSKAKDIDFITDISVLKKSFQKAQQQSLPFLFIGSGSNLLFIEDFQGIVAINQLKGICHTEDENYHYFYLQGGENWHQFVEWTVKNNIGGLENLALIPGCVGSAPIQNIGAYGMEFKDVCDYVEILNLKTNEIFRLTKEECDFGYRESIFKNRYKNDFIIIAVGMKLNKHWQPQLSYGELKSLNNPTPKEIFQKICEVRHQKLPNPQQIGNAGSFFKNPIIDTARFQQLQAQYPHIPHYLQIDNQVKLPAGWLIDQCGLKGFQIGGAKVHDKQALVLINTGNATARDVVILAATVRQKVMEKFGVRIEPEVRFIGATGEIDAVTYLEQVLK